MNSLNYRQFILPAAVLKCATITCKKTPKSTYVYVLENLNKNTIAYILSPQRTKNKTLDMTERIT